MSSSLLESLQEAYRNLDLFPLTEPDKIERFRVDYGLDVLVRLKKEVEASDKKGKSFLQGIEDAVNRHC